MQKLIQIVTLAIAFISGLKQQVADLHAAVADRDAKLSDQASTIETLHQQVKDDAVDDEALETAAKQARADADAARQRTAELQQSLDDLTSKSEQLATAINAHPAVPNVSTEDFSVSAPATQNPAEAELAARTAEARGGENATGQTAQ